MRSLDGSVVLLLLSSTLVNQGAKKSERRVETPTPRSASPNLLRPTTPLSPRHNSLVLGDGLLLSQGPPLLQAPQVPPPLQSHRGDEPLDLGSLGVRLGTLGLSGNLSPDHKLPNIIVLGQVEEPPNLGSPLGSETLGEDGIGQTGDLLFSLLDDDDREDGNVGVDDAASDGLSLTLAISSGSVTRVTVGEEETGTLGEEDSLLHGETCEPVDQPTLTLAPLHGP